MHKNSPIYVCKNYLYEPWFPQMNLFIFLFHCSASLFNAKQVWMDPVCDETPSWYKLLQYTYLNYCCNCFETLATISITVTFVLEWIRLGFGVLRVYTPFKGEDCSSVPSLRLMLPPLEALCGCFFLFLIKIFPISSWGLGSCWPGTSCKNNKHIKIYSQAKIW